jgi:DNA-binding NtrC family response regulator
VLQYGEFEPVGATVSRRIDVRVIAATKVDLEAAIAAGRFRQDLYFRLNVTPIRVPPLREHDDDIPALIDYMVGRFNQRFRSRYITGVAPEAVEALVAYDFPGNVRELENAIEHGFVRCRGRQIRLEHLPAHIVEHRARLSAAVPPPDSLEAMEREFLIRVLDENSWRLNAVADRLCLSRTTLWRRLRRLGIENRRRGSKSADSGEESEQRRRQRER